MKYKFPGTKEKHNIALFPISFLDLIKAISIFTGRLANLLSKSTFFFMFFISVNLKFLFATDTENHKTTGL